jgi:hypothetical protein
MALSALLRLLVRGNLTKSLDLTTPVDALNKTFEQSLISGTGSGQADQQFHDERTLGDGANESLDLAGSLGDAFGTTLTFAKIKALVIVNKDTTRTLSVGGAASNAWSAWLGDATDIIKVPPGGVLAWFNPDGVAVTAGTGDLLKIANAAGGSTIYDIIVIGTSA